MGEPFAVGGCASPLADALELPPRGAAVGGRTSPASLSAHGGAAEGAESPTDDLGEVSEVQGMERRHLSARRTARHGAQQKKGETEATAALAERAQNELMELYLKKVHIDQVLLMASDCF